VQLVLSQFLRVADKEGFAILAYCFMPDHVHLLMEGLRDDSDAKKFITKSKQCSAHAYAQTFSARPWQPFGYEHVLRDDEKATTTAQIRPCRRFEPYRRFAQRDIGRAQL
jgi:REP element-mobilizing transposase RayT